MDDEAQFTLALTHHQAGRLDQAAAIYRALLAAHPRHPDALHLLGLIENRQGRACAAVDLIRQAIALRADVPGFRLSLADAHYAQGDWLAAEQACRAAIALDPTLATAHNHLGVMLKGQNRLQDAEQAYRVALQLHPDYTEAWSNLGNVLKQSGKPHAAEQCYREALRRDAKTPETWNNLGNALQHLSRMDEAEAAYRQAIALKPDFVEAWYNLGIVLGESTRLEEAIAAYMQALQYDFGNTSALDELVHLMLRACLWEGLQAALDELMRRFRARQADLNPYSLLDLPATAAEQLQCGKSRAEKIAAAAAPRFAHTPPAALPARIRIGYLSYDYRPHPVAFLIGELFTLHDAEKFEVYALSIGPDDASPARQHFRDSCAHFIDLAPLSHIEAARTIHDLGIHVLVDLTGYTTGARTEILAMRPAPIQVNWLGYPATSGAPFMDYIVADRTIIPPELERFYSEAVVRLPDCYQLNDRRRPVAAHTPSRAECGLPAQGLVFACFNHTHKIMPGIFDIWMRLLDKTPGSVLWLLESNALAAANLRREAHARGIDPMRIVFAPRQPLAAHLARYRLADLALDTFPYTSHTTASDALWAGCPLLTRMGETFASRVAGSLLHAAGLAELVTQSFAEYEALALNLASDAARLRDLKQRLEAHRAAAPLFNAPGRVRDLEHAYLQMLVQWIAGKPAAAFDVQTL